MTFLVRPAKESDADQIRDLLVELGYATSSEVLASQLPIYIHRSDSALLVVEDAGAKLAGLISGHLIPLLHQSGNLGRTTAMVVSERHRGAGIGRSLVSAMEAWFNAHSCALFEVTSGDHREEAHRFYEGQGYRFDERRFLKIPD